MYKGHPDQRWGHVTYAQHGDDLMLLNIFDLIGVHKPSYIDIGAHHPEHISNTRLLHDRGSRGINVDANMELINLFVDQRPDDINWCAAVVPHVINDTQLVTFYKYSATSGRNTCSPAEVERMQGVLEVRDMQQVKAITLDDVFARFRRSPFISKGERYPDLLTIDVEGLDLEVLQSAMFNGVDGPKVVVVETRLEDTITVRRFFTSRMYTPYCRMGENYFFVQPKLLARLV